MGIPLISNIEPRNGRDYPIAHAENIDVKATGRKLLDALKDGDLTPAAGVQAATDAAIDALFEGKAARTATNKIRQAQHKE
ncbi:hypothetical protein [Bifidobacterium sp. SO4]|uniref:hypothetical protein n=1 Tax=Bifidobacterium sp. SO4 TaxID=2809030 RepID=UPI001BDD2C87|nr:hypothetical protein [Bifidobacterium sp. SO4]MBT1171271.1 hypothetical protein [Bifidobacterium sp. SO4]